MLRNRLTSLPLTLIPSCHFKTVHAISPFEKQGLLSSLNAVHRLRKIVIHMHVQIDDIVRFIPWLRRHNLHYLKVDLFAGLTVAVVALTQSMASAIIEKFSPC